MRERTDDVGVSTSDPVGREAPRRQSDRPRQERGVGAFLAELPVLVLIAFVLALLLKTFLVQAFFIPSESMVPTLEVGDRVLVNKVVYGVRAPRRGEIVVFSEDDVFPQPPAGFVERSLRSLGAGLGLTAPAERDFIKRVVGLPGETLEMRGGVVYIDGRPLPEASSEDGGYLYAPDYNDFGPVIVPPGQYFVMGDNRPNSSDSRSLLGTVEEEDIVGRAFVLIWPVGNARLLIAPDYAASVPSAGPAAHADHPAGS